MKIKTDKPMSKNTWIVIIIVVLVIVAAVSFFLMGSQSNSNQPQQTTNDQTSNTARTSNPSTPETYTVSYDGSRFTPNSINIKSGDTVTFKNNSSSQIRVASNPHPVHTDYPGFDSLTPFGPEKSYSFTFTRIGSWGYHNHLNPSQGGTVVVR